MSSKKPDTKDIYILLVDDEEDLREIFSQHVESWGYKTLLAKDGNEALQIIHQKGSRLAMVISDCQMPELGGFELRQQMLEKWKSIPFVLFSGFTSREEALKAVELKICAFLEKPISPEALKSCIERESKDRFNAIREEDELLGGFIEEARGNLELLEPMIFELETRPHDLDLVNRIFGLVHTMKGASGFFEPLTLHHFVHKFEDLLSKIKNGAQNVDGPVISVILKAVSTLGTLVEELSSGEHVSQLEKIIESLSISPSTSTEKPVPSTDTKKTSPPSDDQKSTDLKKDLRVPIEMLDEFMHASGEMTVIRNMIEKVVRSIEKEFSGHKDIHLLSDLVGKTHKINSHIQTKIIELRKMPMKTITRSFPRVIREISLKLDKDVELITLGDELRIDTAVGDALNSSLIHMIRNSLDHGIETKSERTLANKPTRGKITIESLLSGDDIVINMSDDGRGINVQKIKEKLQKNGMPLEQIERMSEQQVLMQIFEPGFSTAAAVTEVSGRGIGMDMVKTSIQALKGIISIKTNPGEGTQFTIKIPTPKSVLILNSLVVRCGHNRLCIPQDFIVKLLEVEPEHKNKYIFDLQGTSMLKLFDRLIPFLDLREIIKTPPVNKTDRQDIIVIRTPEDIEIALQVDEILDIEDTVVKSLPSPICQIDIYAGVTLLGDGSVSLILSPEGIAKDLAFPKVTKSNSAEELTEATLRKDYILFDLAGSGGLYALPQSQIHRIEKLSQGRIQENGRQKVIPYHGSILPLYDLSSLLKFESNAGDQQTTEYITLVTSQGSRLVGLVVKSIIDIITTDETIDNDMRDRKGLIGAFSVNDKTVCLVDTEALMAS